MKARDVTKGYKSWGDFVITKLFEVCIHFRRLPAPSASKRLHFLRPPHTRWIYNLISPIVTTFCATSQRKLRPKNYCSFIVRRSSIQPCPEAILHVKAPFFAVDCPAIREYRQSFQQ